MPQKEALSLDQKIQVARIAAELLMHHCPELTSSKMTTTLSKQIEIRNLLIARGSDPNADRYADVCRFEQTFEWLYDVVLERVTGESVSLE
ncbi:TPA: hypothetical protein ACGQTY_002494 [Citrobacter farmeri]|uniref:hypothetical protein n=1 Tax=Citrobacter amalonaticus TaxID=35703 RepID=UPI001C7D3D2A|nr:hypothetical protein [Citrobacter amalonaticus]QZA35366.1 hypothetical protein K1713_17215 [Citrobacter amalonaticus]